MSFVAANFIAPYISTSKVLRILKSDGVIAFSINVCNYQKSSVAGLNLNIILEDGVKEYKLDFSSNNEAKQALNLFKQAIDTLRVNCETSITPLPPPAGTPIPISYLQYKSLQTTGALVPFQWYDVTDSTGLILQSGTTIRFLALSFSDFHPEGYVLDSSEAKISINSITDQILFYEHPGRKITLINSNYLPQNIDSNSHTILGVNSAIITSVNSNNLEIENSTVAITNSVNVRIFNSSINSPLMNAQNVNIENLTLTTPLTFSLSNVKINTSDTLGKGSVIRTPVSANTVLIAYKDPIDNEITLNTNNNTIDITLKNEITQANSEFRLKYTGTGTGNKINVKKFNTTIIYVITDIQKDFWCIFRYANGDYEFVRVDYGEGLNGYPYIVTPVIDGQTSFPLPVAAKVPSKLQMSINGQVKYFGLDFTYSSGTQEVTYLNNDFTIASTDIVKFIIF